MKDHDTIIKLVKLGLSNLVEYSYLDTTRTRQTSPNWNPYPQVKNVCKYIYIYIYIYISRDFMWESIRFCQVNILCKENSNILKWHIKDKDKLNIDFLFHLVQCFKIFHPSHIHTKLFAFNSAFSPLTLLSSTPLYILTHSHWCHSMSNTHRLKMMSFTFNILTTAT